MRVASLYPIDLAKGKSSERQRDGAGMSRRRVCL